MTVIKWSSTLGRG